MFTGHVSLEYAKHEHAGWLAELETDRVASELQNDDSEDDQVVAPKRVA
jgi:hypothetical protein